MKDRKEFIRFRFITYENNGGYSITPILVSISDISRIYKGINDYTTYMITKDGTKYLLDTGYENAVRKISMMTTGTYQSFDY